MTMVYGNTIASTWRAYLSYSVSETDTQYIITVNDVGIQLTGSTYIVESPFDATFPVMTFFPHKIVYGTRETGEHSALTNTEKTRSLKSDGLFAYTDEELTHTVDKSAEQQSINVSFVIMMDSWDRVKVSNDARTKYRTSSTTPSYTSTASVELSVPPLAKPTVTMTANRDSTTDTTIHFDISVSSYVGDTIDSIFISCGDTPQTVSGGVIDSSGLINRTVSLTNQSQGTLSCSVRARGDGGDSSLYSLTVPSAFFTMDIGGEGKSIAFGGQAPDTNLPDNGLFTCIMDAKFEGKVMGIHPVGSIVHLGEECFNQGTGTSTTCSTASDYGTLKTPTSFGYEGTWKLIDKRYKRLANSDVSKLFTINSTNVTSINELQYERSDHSHFIACQVVNKVALTDTTTQLATVKFDYMGLASLHNTIRFTGGNDSCNAVVLYELTTGKAINSYDAITRATSIPSTTGTNSYFSLMFNVNLSQMLDSHCEEFVWERIE